MSLNQLLNDVDNKQWCNLYVQDCQLGYSSSVGIDAGITIPNHTPVFELTGTSATGSYALTGSANSAGKVQYVYNGSNHNTTGLATVSGSGSTFVNNGTTWLKLQ